MTWSIRCRPIRCRPVACVLPILTLAFTAACSDDGGGSGQADATIDVSFNDAVDAGADTPAPFTCDDEDDLSPNHTAAEAYVLGPEGIEADDLFVCPGYDDYFLIELPPGGGIAASIDFAHRLGDLDLWLFSEDLVDPERSLADSATENDTEVIRYESEAGGRFVLWVDGFEDAGGLYDLAVQPTCRNDDDCPCGPSSDCETLQHCVLRERVCEAVFEPRCGDDSYEPNNEMSAPFSLIDIAFEGDDVGAELEVLGAVCGDDVDYYAVSFDEVADLDVQLFFEQGNDLDLAVLDTAGEVVGSSLNQQFNFEQVNLPRLAGGDYLVYVDSTAGGSTDIDFDLVITVDASTACTSNADCAQAPGRGICDGGGCVPFEPETASPLGGVCDSADDCEGDQTFCRESGLDLDENFCTRGCFQDVQCDFFEDGRCLLIFGGRFGACFPGCDVEADCPSPYTCAGGACEVIGCGVDTDCGEDQACQRSDFGNTGFCRGFEPAACEGAEADGNDRTSDATELDAGSGPLTGLTICNADVDWYRITIADAPAELVVSADFQGDSDLDVYLYDATGQPLGSGTEPEADPEVARAEYLAAGEYLVRVDQFDGEDPTTYTLEATVTMTGAGCTEEGAECLSLDPLRIVCTEAGVCAPLDGAGEIEPGELCDSSDDCSSASDFCYVFEGAAEGANICTHTCGSEGECNDVPGTTCQAISQRTAVCLP